MKNILSILLKVKPSLEGLKTFERGLKTRMEQVKAFNKRISNGDVALRKAVAFGSAYMSGSALKIYAAESREAGKAEQFLLNTLKKRNLEAKKAELINLSSQLDKVVYTGKSEIQTLEAQLIAAGLTVEQVSRATGLILDHASVAQKSSRESVTDFLNSLKGGQEVFQRWGMTVVDTGDRVNDTLDAYQKSFGGAATAAVDNPEELRFFKEYQETVENLGGSVRRIALPVLKQLGGILDWVSQRAKNNVVFLENVSSTLAPLAKWAAPFVTGFAIVSGGIALTKAALNPLRSAVVAFTGNTMSHYIQKMFKAAAANKAFTSSLKGIGRALSIAAAAIGGWEIGSLIRDNLNIAGHSVGQWVELSLGHIMAFITKSKAYLKIYFSWSILFWQKSFKEMRLTMLEFLNWAAEKFNNTFLGKKLGIEVDNTNLKESIAKTKGELEVLQKQYSFDKAKILKDANESAEFYREVGRNLHNAPPKNKETKTTSTETSPAQAEGGASASPREFVNQQELAIKAARERYALDTKILEAEAEGNLEVADTLKRQIREKEALQQLLGNEQDLLTQQKNLQELLDEATAKGDTKKALAITKQLARLQESETAARSLVTARLNLEDQEIAKERAKTAEAEKRAAIETTLERLQTERQIASERGDQTEANRLLDEEKKLINDLIASYTILAETAKDGSTEQAEALAKLVALRTQLNNSGNQTTQSEQIHKGYNDLSDPDKHLQGGVKEGFGAGLISWVTQVGTVADQVANTISNTIGTAVSGITDGIMGWVNGTQTFGESLRNIGSSILQTMLGTIIQMGVQWLVNQLLIKTGLISINALEDSQRTARVAKEQAADAAVLPGKAAGAAATGIGSFGTALIFGSLALAMIMGIAGGFSDGGFTAPGDKNKPVGLVHAEEWIAPKWMRNHPVYGQWIMGLEGIRQKGYSNGGFTSGIPSLSGIQGLDLPRQADQQSQNQSTQAASQPQMKMPSMSFFMVDSGKRAKQMMQSRGGQKVIMDTDRMSRTETRLRG